MILVRRYSKLDGEKSCRETKKVQETVIAVNTEGVLGAVVDDGLLVKLKSECKWTEMK